MNSDSEGETLAFSCSKAYFLVVFETWNLTVARAGIKLVALLPQVLECGITGVNETPCLTLVFLSKNVNIFFFVSVSVPFECSMSRITSTFQGKKIMKLLRL